MRLFPCLTLVLAAASLSAQQSTTPAVPSTDLTIYNQDFAVARTPLTLDLHAGINPVSTSQVTTQLEPDSVVLRDTSGRSAFRIVEQNYDAGVISQDWMLRKFEGKTIQFQVSDLAYANVIPGSVPSGPTQIVSGKIIRAPREVSPYLQNRQYGQFGQPIDNQPIIEVNGQIQFQLPGLPLFPASTDGLLLKPTLSWQIDSEKAQHFSAELSYITDGLSWNATYNVVAPVVAEATPSEEKTDLTGWVTIHNDSGTEFPSARIQLMAGDVAKLNPQDQNQMRDRITFATGAMSAGNSVTQKPFDDFHLYDLHRTVSLLNGETKQLQFVDASGVTMARSYTFDGARTPPNQNTYDYGNVRTERGYGLDPDNTKVLIVETIKNSEANHLGMPLPAGRIRLYRRGAEGQMEFVGESAINHTPAGDTVKIVTGSAFDVKGSRTQTDFHINQGDRILDETLEIHLTNQKSQPVKVSVQEHMVRGANWEIREKSTDYAKVDSHTVEFPVEVPAKGEATVTYSVRYSW
ncbi:MAG TPA: hypothetical protein VHX60_19035 [Acidobacteriaceae bacterium]|nr:hypothetical protein [Acidobacteriaceae bacterium]